MKKISTLLFSLFLVFLFAAVGRAENRTSGGAGNFTIDEETSIQIKMMACTAYENEIVAHIIHGRLITAFELCRKQGGGVEECIEKIKETREKWRKRCGKDSAYNISYRYKKIVKGVKEVEAWLKSIPTPSENRLMSPIARMAYFQSLNRNFAQLYPGSQFSFESGTGKVVLGGAEIYFQGWKWIQTNIYGDGGIITQVFPLRINWVMDRYNISIFIEPESLRWELIDFNLPFDMQTEKILLALNQGVRVTEKEIIRLADIFLHDTTWGLELKWFFPILLLSRELREDFLKAMVEYFTFDNYIAKVRAEEKRRSKPAEPQQTERKTGTTGPKQKKK